MATKKKDNPAAMAVMGVVLVGALVSVGRTLFAADPAPSIRVSAAAAPGTDPPPARHVGSLPTGVRDPFASPLLSAAAAAQQAHTPGATVVPVLRRVTPVAPARVSPGVAALAQLSVRARPQPVVPRTAADAGPSAEQEATLARSLRVTAIVMGTRPYAVVEPATGTPRTLHVGDQYQALRIMQIRASEIVLKGTSGLWTLPLATPESESAPAEAKN